VNLIKLASGGQEYRGFGPCVSNDKANPEVASVCLPELSPGGGRIHFLGGGGSIHSWLHSVIVFLPRILERLDVVAIETGHDFFANGFKVL